SEHRFYAAHGCGPGRAPSNAKLPASRQRRRPGRPGSQAQPRRARRLSQGAKGKVAQLVTSESKPIKELNAKTRFLNALRGRPVDRPPVAAVVTGITLPMMEQAGVYWPDAHSSADH